MKEQRLKGLLGFSVKARQAVFGADVCSRLLRNGQAAVLLMDEDAGENTRRRFRDLCEQTGTTFTELPSGMLWEVTGKANTVMAIRKGAMADQVIRCL